MPRLAVALPAAAVGAVVPVAGCRRQRGVGRHLAVPVELLAARAAAHLDVGHAVPVVHRDVGSRTRASTHVPRAEVLRALGAEQVRCVDPLDFATTTATATTRIGWGRARILTLGFRDRVVSEPGGVLEPGLATPMVLHQAEALELADVLAHTARVQMPPRLLGLGWTG